MNEHLPIFVYGTLKRREEREKMWPHAPVDVRAATVRAALYDLGSYPAITQGDDLVVGELWFVRDDHLAATLDALDKIEGYNQGGEDLYVRRIVECESNESEVRAYTYFYADETAILSARRVIPDTAGECVWKASKKDR